MTRRKMCLAGLMCVSMVHGDPCAAIKFSPQPAWGRFAFVELSLAPKRCMGKLCGSGEDNPSRLRYRALGPAAPANSGDSRVRFNAQAPVNSAGFGAGLRSTCNKRTALFSMRDGSPGEQKKWGVMESGTTWLNRLTSDSVFMQVLSWTSFFFLLWLVRDFSGVIAGTFIMAFVGNSVVAAWERGLSTLRERARNKNLTFLLAFPFPLSPSRRMLSVIYSLVLVSGLIMGSTITVPLVWDSWRYLKGVLLSDNPYVELANSIHLMLGAEATARVESLLGTIFGEPPKAVLNSLARIGDAPALQWQLQQSLKSYVAASLPIINKLLKGGGQVFAQLMASLLFSFILIYDKPRIQEGVERLGKAGSLIAPIYKEVAPRVSFFGQLVGKSLEAQLMIALWNTLLTSTGLWLLNVSGAAFFSVLVFVCSFIPLLGVLLSTMPMAIVALGEGGVYKMVQVWFMVFFVHVVEAYCLNPQIYSSKLKLHPLLVLVALYVTEHCFGIGALFLAVPVTVFIIKIVLGGIPSGDKVLLVPASPTVEIGKG